MAELNKRTTESKFVTVFADARPDVDLTFGDVLLSRPTNHYLVGVDNLTLCSSNLSMVEPRTGDQRPLLRIVRKRPQMKPALEADDDLEDLVSQHGGPMRGHLDLNLDNLDLELSSEEVFLTVQQLMHRLGQIAATVNDVMNSGNLLPTLDGATGNVNEFGYVPSPEDAHKHLQFDIRGDGHLAILGSKAFWTIFVIEMPTVQYQYGFLGDPRPEKRTTGPLGDLVTFRGDPKYRRFLIVDPETGNYSFDPYQVLYPTPYPTSVLLKLQHLITISHPDVAAGPEIQVGDVIPGTNPPAFYGGEDVALRGLARQAAQVLHVQYTNELHAKTLINAAAIGGTAPLLFIFGAFGEGGGVLDSGSAAAILARCSGTNPLSKERIEVVLNANLFSTMERRVALELGCSLPIKNSPMVDHQSETPDFVLGRWLFKPDTRMASNESGGSRRYDSILPSTVEYQKATDRVVFHGLQPQQKIQTLRMRLFARVRAFDETTEVWTMRVIELPTASTDWWHCRIHFVSKD